ncbi:MAG: bifunctional folylpolyglutamate synthase/dihydrofolate synthase [Oscillospiraceae bacterium]|nr:bifunctional folylpolyglutamate synthase/dihydrofolate synthase [Oscillospiraceae bacterium]
MTLDQAINYIHSLYRPGNKPGLHRIRALLALLGNPEKELKFVHIAGTNGKGSTAAMTASILCKAGYKAGLFTSPYIYRFHERIQMDGKQITDEKLLPLILKVKALADTMPEPPTEFEFVTALAMEYYRQEACPIVVLEVGMGGLLDATNAIGVPEVAVITNIGLDHTEALGNTVEEIALNKAGIFKEGGDAVVYRCGDAVDAVYEQVCREKDLRLVKADFDSLRVISRNLTGQIFDCGDRKALALPLLGEHQLYNASVVLSVIDTLILRGWKITEAHIREGMSSVSWPGRFDIIHEDPLFIIDGGHNSQCFDTLVKNIEDYLKDRKVICLTGVLADKDYADMYRPLIPLVEEFVCVTPPNPRKLEAAQLAEHLSRHGAKAAPCTCVEAGVRLALEKAGRDGVVLSFGSLYLLGAVREGLDAVLKNQSKGE